MASPPGGGDGTGRLRRRHRRLGNDRGGPAALHSLWPVADQPVAFPGGGAGPGDVAPRLPGGVFHRVPCGPLLSPAIYCSGTPAPPQPAPPPPPPPPPP